MHRIHGKDLPQLIFPFMILKLVSQTSRHTITFVLQENTATIARGSTSCIHTLHCKINCLANYSSEHDAETETNGSR